MKNRLTWFLIALFLLVGPGCALGKAVPNSPANVSRVMPVDISGHWAEQDIQAAVNQELMAGTGKNSQGQNIFSPEAAVSRAQLAAVLVRAFQLDYGDKRFIKQPLASDYYQDVDNGIWYAQDVVFCAINGIFEGDGDKFDPNRSVNRVEVARAVQRSFQAKGINVVMIMMMPNYNDMSGLSQEETNALVFVSNTGIMKGDGDNKFRPRQAVKRAELARILNRCTSMMSIDESYNNKEYTVAAGKSFTITLPSNPSTGYSWTLADSGDKTLLQLVSEDFQPGTDSRLVGQAGTSSWKFTALQSGTTQIKLVYSRLWESVQPAKTFEVKIIIR